MKYRVYVVHEHVPESFEMLQDSDFIFDVDNNEAATIRKNRWGRNFTGPIFTVLLEMMYRIWESNEHENLLQHNECGDEQLHDLCSEAKEVQSKS